MFSDPKTKQNKPYSRNESGLLGVNSMYVPWPEVSDSRPASALAFPSDHSRYPIHFEAQEWRKGENNASRAPEFIPLLPDFEATQSSPLSV